MADSIQFGTRYGNQVRVFSNPGSDVSPVYSARFDESGRLVLDPVGEKNVFNEIQSHADEADLNILLQRFKAGETDVLSRVQGFYGDVADVPKSYPEFFNMMQKGKDFFNSLPADLKSKFGNSYEVFLSASQRPDFFDLFKSDSMKGEVDESQHSD